MQSQSSEIQGKQISFMQKCIIMANIFNEENKFVVNPFNNIPYVVAYREKVGSANYQIWATPDLNRRQTGTGMGNKGKVLIKYSDLCYSSSGNKKDICNVMGYTQECDNSPSEGVYWCK